MSFGLGEAQQADWIHIYWPSGQVQQLGPQPAGHIIEVTEAG